MSNSSWQKQLKLKLSSPAQKKHKSKQGQSAPVRVAFLGAGSELNGDDAAGIWVARKLMASPETPAHFLVIEGGSLPENASGPLRRFKPDVVVIVDAADLAEPVGTIQWLESQNIGGMSASSHTLPLSVLGQYLETELGCRVEYLGIQPGQLDFGSDLSNEVQEAVDEIVAEVIKFIKWSGN